MTRLFTPAVLNRPAGKEGGGLRFVNNLVNLHSRTPFRDEPGRPGRCLVQAWAAWPAEVHAPAVRV